jgi:demethylmenaquinone methyltransferase/2-methoxy-6-polyprenyl-1,4-benzoquinol methylase
MVKKTMKNPDLENMETRPLRVKFTSEERVSFVRAMFTRLASRYDLFNRVASLGRHNFWRKAAARRIKIFKTGRVLDLAAGTGDQALANASVHPRAKIIGTDFLYTMLEIFKGKIQGKSVSGQVFPATADALRLPFPDESFDSTTISFGIRNIPDHLAALKEMQRVLVPGGRSLILELTFPRWSFIHRLYGTYLNRIIPILGGLISQNPKAYQYLADSIMDFPSPKDFRGLMKSAGFSRTGYIKLTFGIVVIHWGEK